MRIDLDSLSKEAKQPLHQQLADLMRGAIRARVYQPGDRIESERSLAKRSRLSQPTVTRALKDLAKEGLVVRRPGSGTYVTPQPDNHARRLKKIGVSYYNIHTPYFERLYAGIKAAAQEEGIELSVIPAGIQFEQEDRVIAELESQGVDGIIAVPFGTELMQRELMRLINAGMPVASIGVHMPQLPCDTVGFDHEMAGQLVGKHLLEQGHQRLAFLCPQFLYPDTSSLDMITGVRQAARTYDLSLDDDQIIQLPTIFEDEHDPKVRKKLVTAFKADPATRPTALICSTDGLAHFAYTVLGSMGLRIPRDVSITAGGDLPIASQLDPPLTTVAWPLERIGSATVRLLIDRHNYPDRRPIHRVLDTQLVIRRSTSMPTSK